VAKGFAIFAQTKGNPRLAITTAVNFGRDTDCVAAVAGGLAGALSGATPIPREWIDQVNQATAPDQYTNNKRTIEQTATGLLGAFGAKQRKLAEYVREMSEGATA
jgi:ADP-ribosylglycohydrolase